MQHKILIVEDEEIIRLGLQDNFELENYIVETAADGIRETVGDRSGKHIWRGSYDGQCDCMQGTPI